MAFGDERVLEIVLRARDEASKIIGQVGDSSNGLTRLVRDNYKQAGLAAAGLVASLGLVTKSAVENAAAYEQNRIAFESMLGSTKKASTLLKQVSDFAAKTPFELPQVVEGSKRLLAYNIEAKKIIPTFKMLGDIAAGVGTDKLPQLITAFGQVQAKGKLMGQELLQFTEAGVGLGTVLQKQFGVSREELEKMISTGQVGFADVEKAMISLTSKGGLFFQGMERQSKSFNGILSNISDSFGKVIREAVGISETGDIREGSLFEVLKEGAEKLLVALDALSPHVISFFNFIAENKIILYAIAGAIGGLIVGAIVAAIVAFSGIIGTIALFIAIGAAVGAAIYAIVKAFQALGPIAISVWNTISGFVASIPQAISDAFENAKNAAIQKMTELWNGIVEIWNKIKAVFDSIKNAAQGAIDTATKGINAGKVGGGRAFANGGWVSGDGPAYLHDKEFVLSKDMLSGRQPIPSTVMNNTSSINFGTVIVQDKTDVETLAQRMAFLMKTRGNL